MKIIGIAGKIASGKSFLGKMIREMGFVVMDVDKVNHRVINTPRGREILQQVLGHLPLKNGQVDRRAVSDIIFASPEKLSQLMKLINPLLVSRSLRVLEAAKKLGKNENVVFIECPLLYTLGLDEVCDNIIYVFCTREVRMQRLKEFRNIPEEKIAQIIDLQDTFRVSEKETILDSTPGKLMLLKQFFSKVEPFLNE
ncbi:MAG: dephospho-CoA kinase [Candidatus Pacearchaeota archaeon]